MVNGKPQRIEINFEIIEYNKFLFSYSVFKLKWLMGWLIEANWISNEIVRGNLLRAVNSVGLGGSLVVSKQASKQCVGPNPLLPHVQQRSMDYDNEKFALVTSNISLSHHYMLILKKQRLSFHI